MFSVIEIFDFIIGWFLVSMLFADFFREHFFEDNLSLIKKSLIITLPSIFFHELAHKLTALFLGGIAIYHTYYYGLMLGFILKYMGLPIIFVPAYVSVYNLYGIKASLVALAGPFTNLLIFAISSLLLEYKPNYILAVLKKINLWLFVLNLLPFPGTDGFNALVNLIWR